MVVFIVYAVPANYVKCTRPLCDAFGSNKMTIMVRCSSQMEKIANKGLKSWYWEAEEWNIIGKW